MISFGTARSRRRVYLNKRHGPPLPLALNLNFTSCTMSASIITATTTTTKSKPSRGGGGGSRGSGGRRGGRRKSQNSDPALTESPDTADTPATPTSATPAATKPDTMVENTDTTPQDDDTGTCWICAEPVKYYSVSECNHRTCHVCGLRLRALWKRQDCTFCKVHLFFAYSNGPELTDDFSFPIGTSTFLDLHDVSHRDVRIV